MRTHLRRFAILGFLSCLASAALAQSMPSVSVPTISVAPISVSQPSLPSTAIPSMPSIQQISFGGISVPTLSIAQPGYTTFAVPQMSVNQFTLPSLSFGGFGSGATQRSPFSGYYAETMVGAGANPWKFNQLRFDGLRIPNPDKDPRARTSGHEVKEALTRSGYKTPLKTSLKPIANH